MTAVLILVFRILLLLSLLSFIGWAIYTLWMDLKFQTQSLVSRKIPFISILRENESADTRQTFFFSLPNKSASLAAVVVLPHP